MFDKLTDIMKFVIFLIVYSVGIAYWAGEATTTLKQQSIINSKTVELLNAHIKDCADKSVAHARLEEGFKHLREDVNFLLRIERQKDLFNGLKER